MDDASLPLTEQVHARADDVDLLPTRELLHFINDEDRKAAWAVEREVDVIASAVDAIAERIRAGGKLHYFGAGTSGRIAALDAAEMEPTFGTGGLVVAHIAGGPAALSQAIEGAEDDAPAGSAEAKRAPVRNGDAAVGISASGRTPFVLGAVREARAIGALTLCLTNDPQSQLAQEVDIPIVLRTGPEIIAGSTRMKAAAAQKIALTMLSTAVMVKLGKVHCGLMVDMVATNAKLRARAQRLTARLTATDEEKAKRALERSGYKVKTAVVMLWCGCSESEAEEKLNRARGDLRAVRRSESSSPA